ncbi:MFS transporter [Micromonospora sp. M12]
MTLIAMCLGAMITFLQITATVSALTTIQRDLRVDPTTLVWVPSAYTLMVASVVLSAATLGNRYGRRRMFGVGVLAMIVGAAVVASAPTVAWVIVGQLVAGLGGALILPNSLAILGATFTDPHRRTEVITAWAAASGIGLAIGPLIAGVLLRHYQWHTVYLSTIALGVITLVVAAIGVAESRPSAGRLDVAGLLLGTAAIAAAVYAMIQGGKDGYTSSVVSAAWIVAVVALVGFVLVELRASAPMLDVRLFRSASFSAVMVVAAVSLFGFTGVAILLVLFHERAQALSPLDTGWRMLVLFGAYVVVAFGAGRVIRRTGFRRRSPSAWSSVRWRVSRWRPRGRPCRSVTVGRCSRCSARPVVWWSPRRRRRHWPASRPPRQAWPPGRSTPPARSARCSVRPCSARSSPPRWLPTCRTGWPPTRSANPPGAPCRRRWPPVPPAASRCPSRYERRSPRR